MLLQVESLKAASDNSNNGSSGSGDNAEPAGVDFHLIILCCCRLRSWRPPRTTWTMAAAAARTMQRPLRWMARNIPVVLQIEILEAASDDSDDGSSGSGDEPEAADIDADAGQKGDGAARAGAEHEAGGAGGGGEEGGGRDVVEGSGGKSAKSGDSAGGACFADFAMRVRCAVLGGPSAGLCGIVFPASTACDIRCH